MNDNDKNRQALKDAIEKLKNMTPEERKAWDVKVNQTLKEKREAEERKRNSPPESKTGTCKVCSGTVRGSYVQERTADWRSIPIGPASRDYYKWVFKGYHCEQCGLSYVFPPPEVIVTRRKKPSKGDDK